MIRALALLALLVLPLLALALSSDLGELARGVGHPLVGPALWLTARTSAASLLVIVVCGTPLAWRLARARGAAAAAGLVAIQVPVVVPPAVVGVALLLTFGRGGLLGPPLAALGVGVAFSTAAVVLAQVVVAAPFYVQAAVAAFRRVDADLLLVARTLGASPRRAFRTVALPAALPALVGGAALAWARAAGEFGATLLFAGSLPGRTQTMPLAIYAALEADLSAARGLALILAAFAVAALLVAAAAERVART